MKVKITVETRHLSGDAMARMRERLAGRAGHDGVGDILHAVERAAKVNTRGVFRSWTGRLAGSILVSPITRKGQGWTGEVGPTVIYGRIQELGGTIFPRKGRFLRWEDTTGVHFARHVTLRPRPYFKPGVEEIRPTMRELLMKRLARAEED